MAKSLLEKETIDITDIIELIGDRPYKMPDSIMDYLKEIAERKSAKLLKQEQEKIHNEEELALASVKVNEEEVVKIKENA